jgi:hypothetical protein
MTGFALIVVAFVAKFVSAALVGYYVTGVWALAYIEVCFAFEACMWYLLSSRDADYNDFAAEAEGDGRSPRTLWEAVGQRGSDIVLGSAIAVGVAALLCLGGLRGSELRSDRLTAVSAVKLLDQPKVQVTRRAAGYITVEFTGVRNPDHETKLFRAVAQRQAVVTVSGSALNLADGRAVPLEAQSLARGALPEWVVPACAWTDTVIQLLLRLRLGNDTTTLHLPPYQQDVRSAPCS